MKLDINILILFIGIIIDETTTIIGQHIGLIELCPFGFIGTYIFNIILVISFIVMNNKLVAIKKESKVLYYILGILISSVGIYRLYISYLNIKLII